MRRTSIALLLLIGIALAAPYAPTDVSTWFGVLSLPVDHWYYKPDTCFGAVLMTGDTVRIELVSLPLVPDSVGYADSCGYAKAAPGAGTTNADSLNHQLAAFYLDTSDHYASASVIGGKADSSKNADSLNHQPASYYAGIPAGVICMWSGALGSVPAGWQLCDGTNGTPDLRDRFIMGWHAGVAPGGTGGDSLYTPAGTNGTVAASGAAAVKVGTSSANAAASTHTHAGPTFTGTQATILPPYYKLAFIIKL